MSYRQARLAAEKREEKSAGVGFSEIFLHPEKVQQHISRFELKDDYMTLDESSEKVLLEIVVQRDECCHSGGSLEFGPNGNLFISAGDDTNPHESDGYSPSDEREGRGPWDAQKSSANTKLTKGRRRRRRRRSRFLRVKGETKLFSLLRDERVQEQRSYLLFSAWAVSCPVGGTVYCAVYIIKVVHFFNFSLKATKL